MPQPSTTTFYERILIEQGFPVETEHSGVGKKEQLLAVLVSQPDELIRYVSSIVHIRTLFRLTLLGMYGPARASV